MSVRFRSPLVGAGVLALLGLACTPSMAPPRDVPPAPVVLRGVLSGLEEPVIPTGEAVYRPADRGAESTIAIEIEVASTSATALRVAGDSAALGSTRFAESATLATAQPAGEFRYAITSVDANGARLRIQFPRAWVVADGLRLRVFDAVDAAGLPLQYATIRVVSDFFYMALIGDSVVWGNGLAEEAKFSALVARTIERERGVAVITQRYAHSGATILQGPNEGRCGLDCVGEVPRVNTAIGEQARQIARPELIDLVLMDGCINDVGINNIAEPETDDEELRFFTDLACGEIASGLVRTVRETLPNATIAYVGYYQIIGPESDLFGIGTFDVTSDELGIELGEFLEDDLIVLAQQRDELVTQSQIFLSAAHTALQSTIAAADAERADDPPILFVDPQFGEKNAAFAPQRWLWSLTNDNPRFDAFPDIPYDLFPEDDTQGLRLLRCFDEESLYNPVFCLYVSVGHPNRLGAQRYAEQIAARLREVGLLPAVIP